jgi:hypothetical protein
MNWTQKLLKSRISPVWARNNNPLVVAAPAAQAVVLHAVAVVPRVVAVAVPAAHVPHRVAVPAARQAEARVQVLANTCNFL